MPLIFQATAVARPAYYDRNPSMSLLAYNAAGVAPHATTNRTSLTVPIGKKAWMDDFWLRMTRSGATGSPGLVQILVSYTPGGGAAQYLNWLEMVSGSLQATTFKDIIGVGFVNGGDLIQVQTVDPSVGGTMDYTLACKVTSFDA